MQIDEKSLEQLHRDIEHLSRRIQELRRCIGQHLYALDRLGRPLSPTPDKKLFNGSSHLDPSVTLRELAGRDHPLPALFLHPAKICTPQDQIILGHNSDSRIRSGQSMPEPI
jgi:hypothetical protein